jgi:hypothetical protein
MSNITKEFTENGDLFYEAEEIDGHHFTASVLWKDYFCDFDTGVALCHGDERIVFDINHIKHLRKLLDEIEKKYKERKQKKKRTS